jgi:hypothetical protein
MSLLTITAKGQVTLRKDVLAHLGVRPGEKISVEKLPGGRIAVTAARPVGRISDAFGFLKRDSDPTLSIDEMNRIAAEGWAGEGLAGEGLAGEGWAGEGRADER